MMRWTYLLVFFLVLASAAAIEDELLEEIRLTHYENYPEFTGYINRFSGDSTSETMGMMAMVECSYGSMEYCRDILSWMNQNIWSKDGNYTFAWRFNSNGDILAGPESATDGDLMLLWSTIKAHQRSNDHYYLLLYTQWKNRIQRLDTCETGTQTYIASGSAIGRGDNCNVYNGVYAAYIMPSLLKDLSEFDASWLPIYQSSLDQTYDLFTQNGVFPPRCAGYNGVTVNSEKCELKPNYMDIYDGQRAMYWTGSLCKKNVTHPVCDHIRMLVQDYTEDGIPSDAGYEMDGTPRGRMQFHEFNVALWSPAIEYTQDTDVFEQIREKWNGRDFYGTQCWDRQDPNCVDMFQDASILMALLEHNNTFTSNPSYVLLS